MSGLEFAGFSLALLGLDAVTVPPIVIFLSGAAVVAAVLYFHYRYKRFRSATIKYSDIRIVTRAVRSSRQRWRFLLTFLRVAAISLLFVAFARPRAGTEVKDISSEGIDIMLCLDVSSSMMAEDFKPYNRLYVAKEEIKKFIQKRMNDRIGLVVFARNSFTQCPLTVDYGVLMNFVDQVDFGGLEDGTAIGMAIANALNRLRDSEAKSKVVILVTDGENNAGEIDPVTAANLAEAFNIKIYTVGVGKEGNAMFPYNDPIFGKRYVYQPTKINEPMLREIAEKTGGRYYRARSGEELNQIYTSIDQLEKTEIKVSSHVQYRELFPTFTLLALGLLAFETLLGHTYFRKLP